MKDGHVTVMYRMGCVQPVAQVTGLMYWVHTVTLLAYPPYSFVPSNLMATQHHVLKLTPISHFWHLLISKTRSILATQSVERRIGRRIALTADGAKS